MYFLSGYIKMHRETMEHDKMKRQTDTFVDLGKEKYSTCDICSFKIKIRDSALCLERLFVKLIT